MARANQPRRSFPNWGDHPVILGIIVLAAVVAAIIAVLTYFRGNPQVEYQGRIFDSKTQAPIEHAKITLEGRGPPIVVYTDSEGFYHFSVTPDPQNENARLQVEAPGYPKYEITVNPSVRQLADIRLLPLEASSAPTATQATAAPPPPPATEPAPSATPVPPSPTSSPQITPASGLIADTFDKPDRSDLGSNWAVQSGTFDIHDGQLRLTKFVDNPVTLDVALWSAPLQTDDYTVESDVTLRVTGGIMLIARWQDEHSFYAAELNSVDQGVHLWRVLPNEPQGKQLCGNGFIGGYSVNKTYKLQFTVKGEKLSVSVDGEKKIDCEDTLISKGGSAGVAADKPPYNQEYIDKRWDNFAVYPND